MIADDLHAGSDLAGSRSCLDERAKPHHQTKDVAAAIDSALIRRAVKIPVRVLDDRGQGLKTGGVIKYEQRRERSGRRHAEKRIRLGRAVEISIQTLYQTGKGIGSIGEIKTEQSR